MSAINLSLDYNWEPVMAEPGVPYRFPDPPSDYLRSHYGGPAVYRWCLPDAEGGPGRYYIGETASLARRVRNYIHPGSMRTASRLNRILTEGMATGVMPELQCLQYDAVRLDGQPLGHDRLANKLTRVLVEHLLINIHLLDGRCLLNAKAMNGETEG